MANTFDLNLLPLVRLLGHDRVELPGLYLAGPPRRAARQRRDDRLILFLAQAGNAPLTRSHQDELLGNLAHSYYRAAGSVTAGLRALAEELNAALLERNLRSTSSGRQVIGWLTQILLREDTLYVAQSGPMVAYWLHSEGVEEIHMPELAGQGLGVSRATPVRYYQTQVKQNDTLLVAAKPAPNWSPGALQGLHGQGPEGQRRRLLGHAGPEVEALLVQARPGKGEVHLLKGLPTGAAAATAGAAAGGAQRDLSQDPTAGEHELQAAPEFQVADVSTIVTEAEVPEPAVPDQPETDGLEPDGPSAGSPEPAPPGELTPAPVPAASMPPASALPVSPQPAERPPTDARRQPARPSPFRQALAVMIGVLMGAVTAVAMALDWFFSGIRAILKRVLPDESFFTIPPTTMALVALAVPVVVVAVSSVVYFELGRNAQFRALMSQAEAAFQEAEAAADPRVERQQLRAAEQYVLEAEALGVTPQTEALRVRVQQSLDELDNIQRLDYRQALIDTVLPETARITRLLVEDTSLYMLDQASGNVWRAESNGDGYILDPTFQCGPGVPGGFGVDPLVDMVLNPDPGSEAVLLGMDASGRILRCFLSQPPEAETMVLPFRAQAGDLNGIAEADGTYFVMDPANNAVWVYWGGSFSEEPQFFFGDAPPAGMPNMIDLAAERYNLYLLDRNGSTTLCTFSFLDVAPTRCIDALPYTDGRPDAQGAPLEFTQPFSQVLVSPPPDPSLYLLQADTQGIFNFSLNSLVYQRQFMPVRPPSENPATAFFVNRLRQQFFLAFNDEIYFATP